MTPGADDGSAFQTMSGREFAIADKATAYPSAVKTLDFALTRTEADDHAINRVSTLHSLPH